MKVSFFGLLKTFWVKYLPNLKNSINIAVPKQEGFLGDQSSVFGRNFLGF